ncbi:MAG: type II toxin-antitoxin system Phd/YefM family antitoxin [Hyphomicrobiales bacterium]
MTVVTIHKAKTDLSKLIARVEKGEEIIIARGNQPVARLMPVKPKEEKPRVPGRWRHLQGKIPDSFFFDPLPEDELKLWEGGD